MRIPVLLCLCLLAAPAMAARAPRAPAGCEPAIAAAERDAGTAGGLLGAIGLVESGRNDPANGQRHPWPWTVTAAGLGTYYPTKAAAIEAVQALQAGGTASIDVGCMQVNLMHHPTAFRSLEQAFDPAANAAYAARFLDSLYARLGTWPAAAAAYHSLTPELGAQYAKLIAAVWSGAPVPVAVASDGIEVVRFMDGRRMRLFRDAAPGAPHGRVAGILD